MRYHLSPVRYALECLLHVVGRGPRRSFFTPARDPESRVRFAQYLRRVQPAPDPVAVRRTAHLLSTGGAVSRGEVRHAPVSGGVASVGARAPLHRLVGPGGVAARRRAAALQSSTSLRTLLDALRAR